MMAAKHPLCEITFHVRYAETDKMGVVHHAAYLVWFEEGRSAFIRKRGWSFASIEDSGYFLAASDLRARYVAAAHYDQLVCVRTWISQIRSRTVTFDCEVRDAVTEKPLFTASLKLVCLDRDGKITRIPDSWSDWLVAPS